MLGLLLLATGPTVERAYAENPESNPAEQTSDDTPTFVEPPALPTEIAIGAYLIGLSRLAEPSEPFPTFEVEMFVNLSWNDPRLAFVDGDDGPHVYLEEEAEEKLSEIWSPDLEVQNEVEQRLTESIQLTIFPDDLVDYEERFGATLNADLDLREFPFDRQTLDVELQSFIWDRQEVVFMGNEEQTGFDPDFETLEWTVTGVETVIGSRSEVRDDRQFSSYTFRAHASRRPGHYVLRFMLPLFFVMLLTWAVTWQPLKDRFGVAFLAVLTVVATHTVISRTLPRLSYPTIADVILIICYLTAATLVFGSIRVRRLADRGETEAAERTDRRLRLLLPLGIVTTLIVAVLVLWS